MSTNKITPFLWFDSSAEQAVDFYVSIFNDAEKGKTVNYGPEGPGPEGFPMTVEFKLFGQKFTALNGGPHFKFNESVSFVVNCRSQEEIDFYWEKLSEGGEKGHCGWLKDKFGLSWQIDAEVLMKMLKDDNAEKRSRVMQAMLQMKKIEISVLEEAFNS